MNIEEFYYNNLINLLIKLKNNNLIYDKIFYQSETIFFKEFKT